MQNPSSVSPSISPFGPGRLTAQWLGEPVPADFNPWVVETREPLAAGHRNAFIGNGFIGQRLGIEGDASAYPAAYRVEKPFSTDSGCLVQGLWDERDLVAPPGWALLHYFDGAAWLERGAGAWGDYRQSLDYRTGIVRTEFLWTSGKNDGEGEPTGSSTTRTTRVITRAYIDRCNPGRCVLSRTIIPQFSGEVSFVDELDGRHVTDSSDWSFVHGQVHDPIHGLAPEPAAIDAMSMEYLAGKAPRRRRHVALVSSLAFEEGFALKMAEGIMAHESTWDLRPTPEAHVAVEESERRLRRTLTFRVEAGRRYTVTKVVALLTDGVSPTPRLSAWKLAEEGALDPRRMEERHIAAWKRLWESRVEAGHPRLQMLIHSALYHIYANLREGFAGGQGPCGLSSNGWGGHVFWDSDLWVFPAACLLRPELGRTFVEYRARTLEGSRRNARAAGHDGVAIAWESAEFGDCVIPHRTFTHQYHLNSDVALAQWWFWKLSGDDAFYREKGAPIIIEAARFWASYATFVPEKDRYEICGVCCPDEFAAIRDNNACTNYGAVKTLELAMEAAAFLGQPVPEKWRDIAAKMWLPRNDANGADGLPKPIPGDTGPAAPCILEYEGYAGEIIKQADATLLIYPYGMPLSDAQKANLVDYYRTKYLPAPIMMGAAVDGIIDSELGRTELAWASLLKLVAHFREPFLPASEGPDNEVMAFLTGLGGFLQLLLAGFAGIRIRKDGLTVEPRLPRALGSLTLRGLHYGGSAFDLELTGGAEGGTETGSVRVLNPSAPIAFKITNAKGESWM